MKNLNKKSNVKLVISILALLAVSVYFNPFTKLKDKPVKETTSQPSISSISEKIGYDGCMYTIETKKTHSENCKSKECSK
jgi:hypothetical protein